MISIIIPVLGQEHYTRNILSEIDRHVKEEHEVIVLEGPAGVNEKWNKGAEMAKGDILWIINNDIEITDNTVPLLLSLLDKYKIVCPYTTNGKHKWNLPVFAKEDMIAGWCYMLLKKDWVPIDSRLDLWYGDNWIYQKCDKDVGYAGLIHHYESKTINDPATKKEIQKRINRDKLNWDIICDEQGWNNK